MSFFQNSLPPVRSGKQAADEAFPVARLLTPALRPVVLAFYCLVREADDLADSPHLSPEERQAALTRLWQEKHQDLPQILRNPAADLFAAFHQEATSPPCPDWPTLLERSRRTSVPVGRMLLAVHGEGNIAEPAADALCLLHQLLNHINDLHDDLHVLGRHHLPADWLEQAAGNPAMVADRMLASLTPLFPVASHGVVAIRNGRLAFQAALTVTLARRLHRRLRSRRDWRHPIRLSRGDKITALLGALPLWVLGRMRRVL